MCSTSNKKTECNTLQIHRPNVAMRIIYATVAITTAAFIDAGLVNDKRIVVDHNKVKSAQEKVMKSLDQEFDDLCQKGEIDCIFFDGREDINKVMLKADKSDQQIPSINFILPQKFD